MTVAKVAIIGGGPAGLVTLKSLLEQSTPELQFDPVLFEAEEEIGGTFRWRGYENAALVSSKQLTTFSDFRVPLDHPDHLTLPEYCQYLQDYVDHFNLNDRIQLNCRVVKVERVKGKHHVHIQRKDELSPEVIIVDYLAVCSGLHVIPSIPDIPGIDHIRNNGGEVFHSSEYKSRKQLAGKRVMVLGCGETGMDVSYEAIKTGCPEVVLCHRGGFLSFPKVLNNFTLFGIKFDGNLPIDGLITNLFETAYVHPWVAASHIRWFISDFVVKRVLWLLTGTSAGCNQWVGELPPERLGRAYVFLNKSVGAQPYINRPYKSRSRLLSFISSYADPLEDALSPAVIDLAPFPSHFLPSGRVVFTDSDRKEAKRMKSRVVIPEVVVLATGYTQDFSFLDSKSGYGTPSEAHIRNIVKLGDEGVAFIGFVRPGVGAIPPIAEMQVLWWIALLQKRAPVPTSPDHYHLLSRPTARIKYGVDHSAYMSQLAKDMGAAPGLGELYREHGLHVLFAYCFGAAFPTFYRLTGPFRSPSAPSIVKTELWEVITRRGLIGNITMGLIPMIFYGMLNGLALVVERTWRVVQPLDRAVGSPVERRFSTQL